MPSSRSNEGFTYDRSLPALGAALLAVILAGCGDGDHDGKPTTATPTAIAATATATVQPTATAAASPTLTATPQPTETGTPSGFADLSEEITGGNAPFIGAGTAARLEEAGYVEHEYVAKGTASSYTATAPLAGDGRWAFEEDDAASYRTRILVRRPADPAAFSGTVVVEWLNVSGGVDANPDYASLEEELTRQGHACAAGFVLAEDRDALLAFADPSAIAP